MAILTDGIWKRRFGSDPNVVGQLLTIDGESHTVVSVLTEESEFENIEIWLPLGLEAGAARRDDRSLMVMARLGPGVSLEQARANMAGIAQQLAGEYPSTNRDIGISIDFLRDWLLTAARPALTVLMAAVGLVLAIACANVANLLLIRAGARQKEIAIRTSVGATRFRLVRQLLTESLILALLGGSVGVVVAYWSNRVIAAAIPFPLPGYFRLEIDTSVLAFSLLLCIVISIAFGLVPAWHASGVAPGAGLKASASHATATRAGSRARRAFMVAEVALALALLIGASFLIVAFRSLERVDAGLRPEKVLTMRVSLPQAKYPDGSRVTAFFDELLARIGAVPGLTTVAVSSALPFSPGGGATLQVVTENQLTSSETDLPVVTGQAVSPSYFQALGIALLSGRPFTARDTRDAEPVAIVNQHLARLFWPGQNATGQRLRIREADGKDDRWHTVVGVAGNVRRSSFDTEYGLDVYLPLPKWPRRTMSVAARTPSDAAQFAGAIQTAVRELDPDLPVYRIATMEELIDRSMYIPRITTWLMGVFAAVAVVLAVVGIFGVMSYSVAQRTREMAIRMALGASAQAVVKLLLGEGMRLVGAGLAIGLVVALALTRLLAGVIDSVQVSSLNLFASVALTLAAVALAVIYLCARRAIFIDAIAVIRNE